MSKLKKLSQLIRDSLFSKKEKKELLDTLYLKTYTFQIIGEEAEAIMVFASSYTLAYKKAKKLAKGKEIRHEHTEPFTGDDYHVWL